MFSRRPGFRFNRGRFPTGGAASAAAFDPATLSLTMWTRSDYAGAPWVGETSAGSSGGRNLVSDTSDPATGTAQNGHTPANFAAASSRRLKNTTAMATLFGASGWTVVALLKPRNLAADGGVTVNQTVFTEVGQYCGFEIYSNGVRIWQYNDIGTILTSDATTGPANGAYCMVHGKWDGAKIYAGFNGTYSAGTAKTTIAAATGGIKVGTYYTSATAFLDADVQEFMIADSALSAGNISSIKSYFNSRYGLSL
jgi:hypothetical protein